MRALIRSLASTFAEAITMQAPGGPICLETAQQQHGAYVQLLQRILGTDNVIRLPADNKHPDCVFIEDTAVVAGRTAIIGSIGAAARQGEEAPVAAALQQLGYEFKHIQPPGTLDGGDVLQLPGSTPTTLLVGLSRRTNAGALQQMQQMLPQHRLFGVEVAHGLHLKSACTALDGGMMLYADNEAGRQLRGLLQQHPAFSNTDGSSSDGGGGSSDSSSGNTWQHVLVDPISANVLLLPGGHVVMSSGGASEGRVEQLAAARGLQLHKLDYSEFEKADGALTCCSILLP